MSAAATVDPAIEAAGHEAIQAAGQLLREHASPTQVHAKAPFDLVTDLDTAVETRVHEVLSRSCPDHQFLSEERFDATDSPRLEAYCWVLDPLDGTVNFAFGLPFYSVSLALLHHGEPVLGWVLDPQRDELFSARPGEGPRLNGEPITPPAQRDALPVGISTGLLSHWAQADDPAQATAAMTALMSHYGKIRLLGSQALHLCYVAAGRLRAAVNLEAKLWDDAAGAFIVRAANGRYTDIKGRSIFPVDEQSHLLRGGATRSVAGDPETHATLLKVLAAGQT